MRKQKCSIRVLSTAGEAWTTPRGAHRLIQRGLAYPVAEKTIRMIEDDPRISCVKKPSCRPALTIVDYQAHPASQGLERGFLRYPHKVQTTSGKLHMAA